MRNEAKSRRFCLSRVLKLTIVMIAIVPLSEMGFRKIEEWRAASRAAAFLRKSHSGVDLKLERVTADWPTKNEWKVAFHVEHHPTVYRACVAIDSHGQYSSHFHSINDK